MAAQFVFAGAVSADAKPRVDDPARYRVALRALAGKRIELVIRKPKSKRSIDMNSYLHSETGPFRLMADYCGEDMSAIKLALAGECFGWIYSPKFKREIPVKPNTSDWTVEESAYFVDWVIPWAAREHGVNIEPPHEGA